MIIIGTLNKPIHEHAYYGRWCPDRMVWVRSDGKITTPEEVEKFKNKNPTSKGREGA